MSGDQIAWLVVGCFAMFLLGYAIYREIKDASN